MRSQYYYFDLMRIGLVRPIQQQKKSSLCLRLFFLFAKVDCLVGIDLIVQFNWLHPKALFREARDKNKLGSHWKSKNQSATIVILI